MERLPLEHIRVHDGPQPVTPRPSSTGTLIYCQAGDFPYIYGDGIYDSYEQGADGMLVPLTGSATVFLQCQFDVLYTVLNSPESATVRAWCSLPSPTGTENLQSPISTDIRQSSIYAQQKISISWTAVLTRSESFTVYPTMSVLSSVGLLSEAGGSYFLAAIVGDDTGADCLTWSTPE